MGMTCRGYRNTAQDLARRLMMLAASIGLLMSLAVPVGATGEGVRINADLVLYDEIREEIHASGQVEVRWAEGELTTDAVVFLLQTSELLVPGPVSARIGEHQVSGEGLYYNFVSRSGWFEQSQLVYRMTDSGNLYFRGARIEVSGDEWRGEDLLITGCCQEPPFYSVRARSVTIYPQERLVIEGLGLYIRESRVFWVPAWSRPLGSGESSLLPALGYQQARGYFLDFDYQHHLSNELLFQAQLNLATRGESRLGIDLSATFPHLEARVFYDFWHLDEPSYGGYLHYLNDSLSVWLISYQNEHIEPNRLTRSPQFAATYRHEFDHDLYVGAAVSFGQFSSGDISTWREDFYFLAGWAGEGYGIELFYRSIGLDVLPDARVMGGTVWAQHQFSEVLSAGVRYQAVSVDGSTFFFFDPEDTSELQLDVTYGDLDRSFLRLRGYYDFLEGNFEKVTAGIGLGIDQYSLGVEGVYSLVEDDWQRTRYFLRHRIEECVTVEASWWEPDQTFFLSVELAGFDQPRRGETLFDEEESFDLFGVSRE